MSARPSGPSYAIKGIPVKANQPLPVRQEITAWLDDQRNARQVSLFLRALTQIQAKPVEDQLGYFQLAGIHSYPLVPWDGEGTPQRGKDLLPGFCTHNLVSFPTWHRPYILLYEQVLYENMLEIINGWTLPASEKNDWLEAASHFRMPYWDWARKQKYTGDFGIPKICTEDTWTILKPGIAGGKEQIQNPMTHYSNSKRDFAGKRVPMGDPAMGKNAIKNDGEVPWNECIGTSRYGIVSEDVAPPSTWINGVNDWQASNKGMSNPQWRDHHAPPVQSSTTGDAVSRILTPNYFDSFEAFASTAHNSTDDPNNKNYMSLEYIHNIVHFSAGGTYMNDKKIPKDAVGFKGIGVGHIGSPAVSAFDPCFWMLHCNIDRVAAIWQVLNWDMWFDKQFPGDPKPSDTLPPFHYDTNHSLWTNDMARDWRKFNYQYDDLSNQPPGVPTPAYKATIQKRMSELYPPASATVAATPGLTKPDDTFNDYIINVVYDRYALAGKPYTILFYLGEPTLGYGQAKQDPRYVGALYTFSTPLTSEDGTPACENCATQSEAGILSEAQILLTVPLIRMIPPLTKGEFGIEPHPKIADLEPDAVEKALAAGLIWKFVTASGEADPKQFPKTEIAVLRGEGKHPQEGQVMPRYGGYKKLEQCTKNKPLGFGHHFGPNDLIHDDKTA